jgi:hypothetical protein
MRLEALVLDGSPVESDCVVCGGDILFDGWSDYIFRGVYQQLGKQSRHGVAGRSSYSQSATDGFRLTGIVGHSETVR